MSFKICKDTFAGWNPIIQATTLPSFVLFVIKYEHLESGVIGYIPENGYGGRNNSKFALKYLLWLEHNNPGMKITHKLSKGGEFHADCGSEGFHVDGYNVAENLIYEIHGCIWHGCKKCYPDQEVQSPINKHKKMWELYEETMKKDKTLLAAGYNMCVKWECEIRKEMVKNKEMALFFKNVRLIRKMKEKRTFITVSLRPTSSTTRGNVWRTDTTISKFSESLSRVLYRVFRLLFSLPLHQHQRC